MDLGDLIQSIAVKLYLLSHPNLILIQSWSL